MKKIIASLAVVASLVSAASANEIYTAGVYGGVNNGIGDGGVKVQLKQLALENLMIDANIKASVSEQHDANIMFSTYVGDGWIVGAGAGVGIINRVGKTTTSTEYIYDSNGNIEGANEVSVAVEDSTTIDAYGKLEATKYLGDFKVTGYGLAGTGSTAIGAEVGAFFNPNVELTVSVEQRFLNDTKNESYEKSNVNAMASLNYHF